MTKQEIEDYINTHRIYPKEYKGKRDDNILRVMGTSHRYDPKSDTIVRREGRINDNGDFELVGVFKFPPGRPEEKVEIIDNQEKHDALWFKYTLTKYNDMMLDLDHASGIVKPGVNENWNLRDMVSEVEYLRSLYYTKGHPRNNLKTKNRKMFDNNVARLHRFLRTHRDNINDLVVTEIHNSKYDNLEEANND